MGGKGPDNQEVLYVDSHGWGHGTQREHAAGHIAQALVRFGFLKRDPALPDSEQSWYVNFRWQWRFWRGPYRDAALAMKRRGWENFKVPGWWNTVLERWP
jgi:hypothetical protein